MFAQHPHHRIGVELYPQQLGRVGHAGLQLRGVAAVTELLHVARRVTQIAGQFRTLCDVGVAADLAQHHRIGRPDGLIALLGLAPGHRHLGAEQAVHGGGMHNARRRQQQPAEQDRQGEKRVPTMRLQRTGHGYGLRKQVHLTASIVTWSLRAV